MSDVRESMSDVRENREAFKREFDSLIASMNAYPASFAEVKRLLKNRRAFGDLDTAPMGTLREFVRFANEKVANIHQELAALKERARDPFKPQRSA